MFKVEVHPTMYDGKSITATTKFIWKKYHAKRRLEDNVDNDLIEEYDDYVMDEVEDEEDETEFYFDEIIDKFKFSDHNEVLHEDSLETVDPNLENSSIIAPNLEELAESSECFDNIKDHYLLKTSDPLVNSN